MLCAFYSFLHNFLYIFINFVAFASSFFFFFANAFHFTIWKYCYIVEFHEIEYFCQHQTLSTSQKIRKYFTLWDFLCIIIKYAVFFAHTRRACGLSWRHKKKNIIIWKMYILYMCFKWKRLFQTFSFRIFNEHKKCRLRKA